MPRYRIYEEGKFIGTYGDWTRVVAGLNLSMATVDCDPSRIQVLDENNKVVYQQPKPVISEMG